MRVLWPHNFPPSPPASGRFMHVLAQGMRDLGIEVDLLFLGNLRRPGTLAHARRELKDRASGYDLVHTQFGSACAFVAAAVPGIKVLSLRGSDWHPYRGWNLQGLQASILATTFSRLSIGRFDAIITMSNRMTREVRAATGHRQVYTIPDPIDLERFRPRRTRRHLAPGDKAAVLFTTLSTANALKRVALARAAVEVARSQWPGLELRIASGIAPDDMPAFVDACDVVLCTSTHEGWPNSVKEALACGLPFVSTDVSDLAEVAQSHRSCRVCDADPVALGNGLCEALRSPVDPSLPQTIASMSVRAISERLAGAYTELLRQHSPSTTGELRADRQQRGGSVVSNETAD